MSAITDENNSEIDPEAEVRKLQELVKKLERQNQILRSKQNQKETSVVTGKSGENDVGFTKINSKISNGRDAENLKDAIKDITLDEVELVDVDKAIQNDEEDSWLFVSPKKLSPAQKNISPYKWVRTEFEKPSPEIETVRRSLIYKLDEMSRGISRSSSAGTLSLTSPSSQNHTNDTESCHSPPYHHSSSSPALSRMAPPREVREPSMPSIKYPLVSGLGTRVDTNTFTRPKKNRTKPSTYDGASNGHVDTSNDEVDRPNINKHKYSQEDLDVDSDTDVMQTSTLSNVSDVQLLARMQEESLRQSFSSPITSPSRKCDSYLAINRSKDSLASGSSPSNASTPPDSPYSSNQTLNHKPQVSDQTRRSMPNLSRTMHTTTLPSRGSESNLPSRDSPPRRQVARMPGSGARQSSPGRPISPQRTGIPMPRTSGIPRPGSQSKLPTPRNSVQWHPSVRK